jgi:methylmalonyl-CoA/ethylmalonyl-CoA epimerase
MTVLDHFAVGTFGTGTGALADGWDLFSGVLGGTWAYGMDSSGYWWGQVRYAAGPNVELLTPTGGPDGAFLERFLASRGPGPHHLNFASGDIEADLARIRAAGIEPVQVSLASPDWKEAFLHPRDAFGIVIQVAQSSGTRADWPPPPAGLPEPGPAAAFDLIEHHVADLAAALRLFAGALGGEVTRQEAGAAELAWPGGGRIRLVQPAGGDALPLGGTLHHVRFTRTAGSFSDADASRAGLLAKRLGLTVELG